MRRKLFILNVAVISVVLCASVVWACNCGVKKGGQASSCQHQCNGSCGAQSCSDNAVASSQSSAKQEVQASMVKPIEVGNKICPVSGNPVGKMGPVVKHEYKGKIYNLCCGMCPATFNKNPEKYAKIAEKERAAIKK